MGNARLQVMHDLQVPDNEEQLLPRGRVGAPPIALPEDICEVAEEAEDEPPALRLAMLRNPELD